jgi:catechol 2,3-dioxygenase-like lactoylglutathione lyase family enzyme
MVNIIKLQHIGIPVTDMAVSELFYTKLGFINVMQSPFELEGDSGLCVMMKNGEMLIELYQLPDKLLPGIRGRAHGHIDHIAFDVDDIDLVFEEIKAAGFTVLEEQVVELPFWKNGCRYFNIVGPDGERLEFNEVL